MCDKYFSEEQMEWIEQLNLLLEYYVLEKSISEIAEEMGLSYPAVTNRLDRIRKALKKATEK